MVDSFEREGLQTKVFFNGIMTRCQQTASHGGSVQAVRVQATQNMPTDAAQREATQTSPCSTEHAASTASTAKTGTTET